MSRWRGMAVALGVLAAVGIGVFALRTRLLEALTFFPARPLVGSPGDDGLEHRDLRFTAEDGIALHGWWLPAPVQPSLGHVLVCHGNAGNIASRIPYARRLGAAGLDVLLFDYRGYGASAGRPSERGTYLDARAARLALLAIPGVSPERIVYLGESLGGAIALELAVAHPPRGLVLQSTFTSLRDMARLHYPLFPRRFVPDAYPSLARIARLRAPLLVLHGSSDDIVPLAHGESLFRAAPGAKRLEVFPGLGHNDLVSRGGEAWSRIVADWVRSLGGEPR